MLNTRRIRFQSLLMQARKLSTPDLISFLQNDKVASEPLFRLARVACLRIYIARTDLTGRTYARQRDAARRRLGLLNAPRLIKPIGRARFENAGKPWEIREDATLRNLFFAGQPMDSIAEQLRRTRLGIETRLQHLRLMN
jgi:hypothetical protein